jgi:predicted transcriptional regulator
MRTTLTLDDDVAAKLKAEARRIGRPFREIVNNALRDGFASPDVASHRATAVVAALVPVIGFP